MATEEEPVPQAAAAPDVPPPVPGFLTWAARRGPWLIALFCLALWLPGIVSLPALDRDESRFAQSSRQMLDSGNYVDIRFGQVPRYKKPVGIYWLQSATTAIAGFGDHSHIWTYRLPSLLGGMAAAILTFWCAALFSAEAGLLAGLLVAASLLLTAEATQATTDAALLAAIVFTQGVLFRLWRAARADAAPPSLKLVMAGWAAFAIAILLKGPVVLGVVAMTLVVLTGLERWEKKKFDLAWLKAARPRRGLALAVLIVAPWAVAIALASHGEFFQQSLGGDFAAKIAEGQEGHGQLPGYYLLVSSLTFWPMVLFVLPGVGIAFLRRAEPSIRFLIAWAAGWWILVEIVPTKLPNYVLPALPPLAMLAALWILAARDETGWRRWLPMVAAAQSLLGLALFAAAPFILPARFGDGMAPWWLLALAYAGGVLGLAGIALALLRRRLAGFFITLAATLILVPNLTAGVGPLLSQLWFTGRLAQAAISHRQAYDPPPMLAGYEEPSMVFALGKDVALTDGKGAAELGLARGGLALVDDENRPAFLARLAELQGSADAVDAVSGFNYSRGRSSHVTFYRIAPLNPVTHPLPH
jgi:4-amino-4-deoxy-L-arabinose transferase-like glycosyltransferase